MPEFKVLAVAIPASVLEDKAERVEAAKFDKFENDLQDLLIDGWELDGRFAAHGVIALENAIFYHFVKYTPEEKEAMLVPLQTGPKIVALIDSPLADVNTHLGEGYQSDA